MAKKKVQEEEVQEETTASEAPAEDASPKPEKATEPITVKYRDHQGKPTERTFSHEVHGEDFAKLADEFKQTNASKLIA